MSNLLFVFVYQCVVYLIAAVNVAGLEVVGLKAFFQSVTGELMTVDTGAWFESFSTTEYSVVPFHVIVVIGTLLTLLLGVKSIEKTNKVILRTLQALLNLSLGVSDTEALKKVSEDLNDFILNK